VSVAAPLLELLSDAWATSAARRGQPSTGRPQTFAHLLLAPEKLQNQHSFSVMLLQQVHLQLAQFLSSFSRSPAFPEVLLPVLVVLRRFVKQSRLPEAVQRFRTLIDRAIQTSKLIEAERSTLSFGPGTAQESQLLLRREGLRALPIEIYVKEVGEAQERIQTIAHRTALSGGSEEKAPQLAEESDDMDLDESRLTDLVTPLVPDSFQKPRQHRDERH